LVIQTLDPDRYLDEMLDPDSVIHSWAMPDSVTYGTGLNPDAGMPMQD
jgi:hypothetical protein